MAKRSRRQWRKDQSARLSPEQTEQRFHHRTRAGKPKMGLVYGHKREEGTADWICLAAEGMALAGQLGREPRSHGKAMAGKGGGAWNGVWHNAVPRIAPGHGDIGAAPRSADLSVDI